MFFFGELYFHFSNGYGTSTKNTKRSGFRNRKGNYLLCILVACLSTEARIGQMCIQSVSSTIKLNAHKADS
jgi:hypothetical protein